MSGYYSVPIFCCCPRVFPSTRKGAGLAAWPCTCLIFLLPQAREPRAYHRLIVPPGLPLKLQPDGAASSGTVTCSTKTLLPRHKGALGDSEAGLARLWEGRRAAGQGRQTCRVVLAEGEEQKAQCPFQTRAEQQGLRVNISGARAEGVRAATQAKAQRGCEASGINRRMGREKSQLHPLLKTVTIGTKYILISVHLSSLKKEVELPWHLVTDF